MERLTDEERTSYNTRVIEETLIKEASRLDRIEAKLDRLTDVVVDLARAEEKLLTLERSRISVENVLDDHEERLNEHEKRLNSGAVTLNAITKTFWLLMTGIVTAGIAYYITNAV
jgi:hypothetical protein